MGRTLLLAAFVAAASGYIAAQTPTIDRVNVTEYGIYTSDNLRPDKPSEDGVKNTTITNVKLAARTHQVPLQKGVQFGFRFVIEGSPAKATVPVRTVIIYPGDGAHMPGSAEPMRSTTWNDNDPIGPELYYGYTLEDDWELIPGNWTLELWVGDKKLASQTFTVTP